MLRLEAKTPAFLNAVTMDKTLHMHAALIEVFLRPCPSAIILRNLLFLKHSEHFKIDGDGPAIVDYIISKTYLNS